MPQISRDLNSTRWTLVRRLKDWSDRTSWQEFFDSYSGLIYSVACQAGLTECEAQEVVQETVISVAKSMESFKADSASGSFRGWLLRLTRRRIVDQFRKRPPRGGTHLTGSEETRRTATIERIPDPDGVVLEHVWNAEWKQHLMQTGLERIKVHISPRQYQVFHLLVVKNLPPEKVAELARVKVANVYLIKHRVAALLKKEIQELERNHL